MWTLYLYTYYIYNAKDSLKGKEERNENENPFFVALQQHKDGDWRCRRRAENSAKYIERHLASERWTQRQLLPIYGALYLMLCSHVTSKKFANLAISETFNTEKKVTRRTYVREDGHIAAVACIIGLKKMGERA